MPAKENALPAAVKVGGLDYAIQSWPAHSADKAGALGLCDNTNLTIMLREGLKPAKLAEVVVHEILHAAWDAAALYVGGQQSSEERVVAALGYQLLQIWRDNPEVVSFLEGVFRPQPN